MTNPLLVGEPLHVPIHVVDNMIVVEIPVLDTKLDTAHDIDNSVVVEEPIFFPLLNPELGIGPVADNLENLQESDEFIEA